MAWWSNAGGYIANGYGTTYAYIINCNTPKWSRWGPISCPQGGCQCSTCTELSPACSQQRVAPVTLTRNHSHPDCSEKGTRTVWETVRWHGMNWENVPVDHIWADIYMPALNAIDPSHLSVQMQAGSIIYPVTALVTGMPCLFSIIKRSWTHWTDWIRKPMSVVSCKQHRPYITDACRESAVVPVLLGSVQLLFPEWSQQLWKLTRHGAWKLWPLKQLQFGFLNLFIWKKI